MKLLKPANVSLISDSRIFFKFLLSSEILKENKNFSIKLWRNFCFLSVFFLYVLCQHISLFWPKCRLICYNVCDN